MRATTAALGALVSTLAFGIQAQAASPVPFQFSNSSVSATGFLSIARDVSPTDPNSLCGQVGQNACRADPVGAWTVTGITGTFSDSAASLSYVAITGIVPISPTNEKDAIFDPLVPTSLSYLPGTNLSYNNLFFPDGSPIDCDFPFKGTYLDVFGMAFTLANGDDVVIWGDGNNDFGPLTYGVAVSSPLGELDYQFAGVTGAADAPEPSTWLMLAVGVGAVGFGLRRHRRLAVTA